ncbi:MAG: hypothetical protein ACREFE_12090 [Limisphaerales bacterium]
MEPKMSKSLDAVAVHNSERKKIKEISKPGQLRGGIEQFLLGDFAFSHCHDTIHLRFCSIKNDF